MKKLNNISVSRIVIFSIISVLINKTPLYILFCLLLLIYDYKETIIYVFLICFVLSTNSIKVDFIPYGIVEKKENNSYIVYKLFYKAEIKDNNINIGDIIYSKDSVYLDSKDKLKRNIKFKINEYETIYNLKLKGLIYERINTFPEKGIIGLNKFLYNINSYDDLSFNLGYGLAIYYLIKFVSQKHKGIGLVFIVIYAILFYFDPKFYLLILDILISNKNSNKYWYRCIFILIINKCLFYNYSILIPLLLNLSNFIYIDMDFKEYMIIIESILFGNINIISVFLFKYIIYFQIILLCLSLIVLIFPILSPLYILLLNLYSLINNINLEIRGSLSIFGILIYEIIKYSLPFRNKYLDCFIICLIILSKISNPFLSISFIDVGQGDAEIIKLPFFDGNILIDTGSKYNYYNLRKYLFMNGIYNIDYLIITHDDSDHNGNLESLNNDFNIKNIIIEGKDIGLKNLNLKYLYIDDFDNDNDNSLVYYLNINDIKFLFTGDISSKAEEKLVNKYGDLDIDILKVTHHGSSTGSSEYFIKSILPKISIISTSGQYNHPSYITIENLEKYLSKYYITKDDGTIEIYLTGLINILKSEHGDFVIIR